MKESVKTHLSISRQCEHQFFVILRTLRRTLWSVEVNCNLNHSKCINLQQING